MANLEIVTSTEFRETFTKIVKDNNTKVHVIREQSGDQIFYKVPHTNDSFVWYELHNGR
jgi:hypothetical protein